MKNGFVAGMLLGAAAGAAADLALHTATGKRTSAGRAMPRPATRHLHIVARPSSAYTVVLLDSVGYYIRFFP